SLTGSVSPRRWVCAPGVKTLSWSRRPPLQTGDTRYVVDLSASFAEMEFRVLPGSSVAPSENTPEHCPKEAVVRTEAGKPRRSNGPQHADGPEPARQGGGLAPGYDHPRQERR